VHVLSAFSEAILNSMNLLDKTFAEQFVLVLFHEIIQFAVGYKYTNWSKLGINSPQDFFTVFRSALNKCRVVQSGAVNLLT